jgi:hypothetical protein
MKITLLGPAAKHLAKLRRLGRGWKKPRTEGDQGRRQEDEQGIGSAGVYRAAFNISFGNPASVAPRTSRR